MQVANVPCILLDVHAQASQRGSFQSHFNSINLLAVVQDEIMNGRSEINVSKRLSSSTTSELLQTKRNGAQVFQLSTLNAIKPTCGCNERHLVECMRPEMAKSVKYFICLIFFELGTIRILMNAF